MTGVPLCSTFPPTHYGSRSTVQVEDCTFMGSRFPYHNEAVNDELVLKLYELLPEELKLTDVITSSGYLSSLSENVPSALNEGRVHDLGRWPTGYSSGVRYSLNSTRPEDAFMRARLED